MQNNSWVYTDLKNMRNKIEHQILDREKMIERDKQILVTLDAHLRQLEREFWK